MQYCPLFLMAVQAQFFPDSSGFETGCCFDFQLYNQQNHTADPSSSSYNSSMSSFDSFDVHQYLEMQNLELDCFLQSQAEGLKFALKEQTRQQMGLMLKRMECEAMYAMKQKEEALIRERNRSLELESCVRKAQRESECWQEMAKEKEAMATNLSRKLEQARESMVLNGEDSESICCASLRRDEEEREKEKKVVCKGCKSRESCLVFLPCRHLCCCNFCEVFFVSCPVCESFKQGTIQVFLF